MDKNKLKKGVHTFVICAYKESEYLEECIKSLLAQTLKSEIIMITSTPNEYIKELSQRYDIPLIINEGEGGIAQDWNFGIEQTDSDYVTIAHQDDVYEPDYLREVMKRMFHRPDTLIAFTDYGEIRDGCKVLKSKMLTVKRLLLLPLRIKPFQNSKLIKRRILSLGNPICCPSVTYSMKKLEKPLFKVQYGSNLDWQTWENFAAMEGDFVYVNEPLMFHRIHEESTTSGLIKTNDRAREDRDMLNHFWPEPIANIISKAYGQGEKLN